MVYYVPIYDAILCIKYVKVTSGILNIGGRYLVRISLTSIVQFTINRFNEYLIWRFILNIVVTIQLL